MKGATKAVTGSSADVIFQSTLPWRERQASTDPLASSAEFQSTLPWRERQAIPIDKAEKGVFQSTLPWRERPQAGYYLGRFSYFNPRSREGSDNWAESRNKRLCNFNPRSREGSDDHRREIKATADEFQSTLPWRERLRSICNLGRPCKFQSTLPWRERLSV